MAASLVVRLRPLLLLLLLRGGSPSSGEREREGVCWMLGAKGRRLCGGWVGGRGYCSGRRGGGGKGPSSSAYRGIQIYHRTEHIVLLFFLLFSRTQSHV